MIWLAVGLVLALAYAVDVARDFYRWRTDDDWRRECWEAESDAGHE